MSSARFDTTPSVPQTTRRALGLVGLAMLVLLWYRCAPRRVVVEGPSMLPTLDDGERLLVTRPLLGALRLRVGDVVVVRDPDLADRLLVKRIASVEGANLEILGDNPALSRDSRVFGPVPISSVLGRAWYRYSPGAKAGRLLRS